MRVIVALLCFGILLSAAHGTMYEGCDGTPNDQPLVDQQPNLVATVPNGRKYTTPYDQRFFYVLVLNGSAYEMGYAYGQLMKNEIPPMVEEFFGFVEWIVQNNVSSLITKLPKFLKNYISKSALIIGKGLLDLNYYITLPYTPKRWNDEMQGISDASGVSIWTLRQINLISELLKASCSILGGFGKSTASGETIHLRSLDWEAHAPMSRWPLITVYHSTESGSYPFANIAWPTFIGSLTGYSSQKIGVGERLRGAPPQDETRFGTPWPYVLRDALQFSKTQKDYIQYLLDAHRTCSVYLGVGGDKAFDICEYTYTYLRCYNWTNWHQDIHHPVLDDILWKAYHDGNDCFKNIVLANYGNITAETIYRLVAPLGQTGDSQVAVMDYANDVVYCMYPNPNTFNPGFNSPPIKIDLKPFFNKNSLNDKLE